MREKVIDFYEKWYSSNLMSVVLISNKSLEELSLICEKYFGVIKDKNVEGVEFPILPYEYGKGGFFYKYKSVKDIPTLEIKF